MTQISPDGPEIHPLIAKLLEKLHADVSTHRSRYRMRDAAKESRADSILEFLDLDTGDLSSTASEALEALNQSNPDGWTRFQWQLTAFTYLQDNFDTPFHDAIDRNPLLLFEQYYFYFESVRLLKESILCGLNGFSIAANALMRPFLEFSLLQNYFYRALEARGSFAELERYFQSAITPATQTLVKKAMPSDAFSSPIRFRINQHLGGLSQSTLHPYHPSYSPVQHNTEVHVHSLETLHFWGVTSLVLEAALWMYYVNFPMLFTPVNIVRRFGFNAPVGLFVDEGVVGAVRNSLSGEDFVRFRDYATAQSRTRDCLAFLEGQRELTDDEIAATWRNEEEDGPFTDIRRCYALLMARTRGMRVALAHRRRTEASERQEGTPNLDTLAAWQAFSSMNRHRRR
jgi:hypothetical protein